MIAIIPIGVSARSLWRNLLKNKNLEELLVLRRNLFLFVTSLLLAGVLAGSAFAARGEVRITLTPVKDAFGPDESVMVNVSITNPNKGAVRILRWSTPIDGVEEDLFHVVVNGKDAEYIGRHYKRPAPTDKDYLILRGGETIETTVDLSGYYDLAETGYYRVGYYTEGSDIYADKTGFGPETDELLSEPVQIWITGRETRVPEYPMVDSVAGSTSFVGCTTSRQNDLNTARNNASGYSSNSLSYLNTGTAGPRYTTWFGTYDSNRYNTVRTHFSSILNAMDNAAVTFSCQCTSSAYAYVYSNQPYTIYLCNAFWNAPAQGTDSKAGTLVHEMSHFTVVAGTDDHAYGQTACKKLAKRPQKAIDNADSHEYFAENTPFQN